jgi:hypothetical protein
MFKNLFKLYSRSWVSDELKAYVNFISGLGSQMKNRL